MTTPREALLREFPQATCWPDSAIEQFGGMLLSAAANDAPGETVRYDAARQSIANLLRHPETRCPAADDASGGSVGWVVGGILGAAGIAGLVYWWVRGR